MRIKHKKGYGLPESAITWTVLDTQAERGRFKDYNRRHPREYAACFANLDQLVRLLHQFGGIGGFQLGFLRSEGQGVYRIGQTGVKHAHETRLYVFVDDSAHTVNVLTIGDKDTQSDDIRRCHASARRLRKG